MRRLKWLLAALTLSLMAPLGVAAEGDGDPEKGKEIFDTKCLVCHDPETKEKKIGPGLQGVSEGKLPSGKDTTYENVLENLNKGGGGMPPFEKVLTDEEKDHVVAYVLTL